MVHQLKLMLTTNKTCKATRVINLKLIKSTGFFAHIFFVNKIRVALITCSNNKKSNARNKFCVALYINTGTKKLKSLSAMLLNNLCRVMLICKLNFILSEVLSASAVRHLQAKLMFIQTVMPLLSGFAFSNLVCEHREQINIT